MEPILDGLVRRLKEAGPRNWEAIALAAGVSKELPRKLVYGDRENPGVQTIQPLVDLFARVESGKQSLPRAAEPATHQAAD